MARYTPCRERFGDKSFIFEAGHPFFPALISATVRSTLQQDLFLLKELGCDDCLDIARSFHRLGKRAHRHPDFNALFSLYQWLFTPYCLWCVDFDQLLRHATAQVARGKRLKAAILLLAELLGDSPQVVRRDLILQHMQDVEEGKYEGMVRALCKYEQKESELAANATFRQEWNKIKALFPVRRYWNKGGVIHREIIGERNTISEIQTEWKSRDVLFQAVFNTFCQKWSLYGMRKDHPLLLKISVNLTPYGTMIFVPSYWSLDWKRDFDGHAISKLHRSRGVPKQGPKLGSIRLQRLQDAGRARQFITQARRMGFRGERRIRWMMDQLRWHVNTDPSRLRRLLQPVRSGEEARSWNGSRSTQKKTPVIGKGAPQPP